MGLGKKKDDYERIKIQALAMLMCDSESIRSVARKLGVGKTTISRWKKEHDLETPPSVNEAVEEIGEMQKAEKEAVKIKVSDRYCEYVQTLQLIKDRQGKWAGAINETGIRTLKFANKFLAVVERKEELEKHDLELIRLIPMLLNSSASAVKSAGEAEDRAYSLELLIQKLDELPNQI